MKILHTADIHLKQVGDSRWRALEHLLRIAGERRVSVVAISGDMFDRYIDAPKLKAPLRDLFHQHSVPVVILPGNHDARAIDDGDYYGDNVTVITRSDWFVDFDDVRVFGLPFEKIEGDEVIEKLLWIRDKTRSDGANVLLYHGELLDMVHARDGFGNEDLNMYMPVRLSYFDDLGLDYVLAGHFHSSFEVRRYRDGYFVYPGSPVSITRKETGVRKANLFEVGKQPMPLELDTTYFHEIAVKLNPLDRADPVDEVEKQLHARDKNARILVRVTGFVDLLSIGKDERELHKAIGALMTPDIEDITQRWRDVGLILQNDLFGRCMGKLDVSGITGDRLERVKELIMESMMESQDAH